ncbi:MAG: hypothetical protein V1725_06215 [archaeon]
MKITNAKNTKTMLRGKKVKNTNLFHHHTFLPSSIATGSMLNKASHELMSTPNRLRTCQIPRNSTNGKKNSTSNRFTAGPTTEMMPFCFFVMWPEMYTAPGAARMNPNRLITTPATAC